MPPQQQPDLPLIGYIRVSLAREEMISPEIQKSTLTAWAKRSGRTIVDWVIDLDKTGRNVKRKIMKVIARVEAGEASGVAVMRYDRWGRNTSDSLMNIARVEAIGGIVESATEPLDPATAMGRYNRTNALALAEMQSDLIGEGWKGAHATRLARGLPIHGQPRWGYDRKGRIPLEGERRKYRADPDDPLGERYEPNERAPALRSLYERYVAGTGGPTLVTWLNHKGIPSPKGKTWSIQALYKILDSGFAAGYLREHDPKCACRGPAGCQNVTFHPGAHRAIISEELWTRYRTVRKERSRLAPRARTIRYPLNGLMWCGGCGARMTTSSHTQQGAGYSYRCDKAGRVPACTRPYILRKNAEARVLARLTEYAGELEGEAATAKVRPVAPPPDVAPDTSKIEADIARIDKALVRLRKLRALEDDDDAQAEREYQAARAELITDRGALEERLNAATKGTPKPRTKADCGPVIDGLIAEWHILTPPEKHGLLAAVIRRIDMHPTGPRMPVRMEFTPIWAPL